MGPLNRSGRKMLVLLLLVAAFFAWNIELVAQTSPSPKQLKLQAITALEQISTTDNKLQRMVKTAIRAITRSLSDRARSLFLDDFRILPPPGGEKVFQREQEAAERLLKAIKWKRTPEDIKIVIQQVIGSLVEADRRITEHSIATAEQLVQVGAGAPRKLAKAQREFGKALQETHPPKAIKRFKKAWESSQEVVEGSAGHRKGMC